MEPYRLTETRAPLSPTTDTGAAREIAVGIPKEASRATAVHIADTESVVRQGRDDAHLAQLRVPGDGQQGAGVRGNHERVRFPARPTRKLRPVSTLSFQCQN